MSDRAKKTTLARVLGMDATVVVMPQGQLAEIVKRNIHKGNRKKAPQREIVWAGPQGGIPKGTPCAGGRPQGERSPERQPGEDPGQEEGSYIKEREEQQEQEEKTIKTQRGYEQEGANPRSEEQPQESWKERKRQ